MTAPLPRRAWGAICGGDLLVGPLGGAAGGPPAPTPGPPLLSGEAPTNEGELPLRLRGRDWVPAGAACRSRPLCSPGSAGEVVGVALSPAPLSKLPTAHSMRITRRCWWGEQRCCMAHTLLSGRHAAPLGPGPLLMPAVHLVGQ